MGWDQEVKDRQVLNDCVSEDQRWGQWRRAEKSAQESIHQGASGEGTWEAFWQLRLSPELFPPHPSLRAPLVW